jgi:hypothetical protein
LHPLQCAALNHGGIKKIDRARPVHRLVFRFDHRDKIRRGLKYFSNVRRSERERCFRIVALESIELLFDHASDFTLASFPWGYKLRPRARGEREQANQEYGQGEEALRTVVLFWIIAAAGRPILPSEQFVGGKKTARLALRRG